MHSEEASAPPSPTLGALLETFSGQTWDIAEVFARLRDQDPVMYVPMLDMWAVSRYEDVAQALRNVEHYLQPDSIMSAVPEELSAELPDGYALSHTALTNANPPVYARIRKLAQKPLTPKAVKRYEPMIREVANGLIDRNADPAGMPTLI